MDCRFRLRKAAEQGDRAIPGRGRERRLSDEPLDLRQRTVRMRMRRARTVVRVLVLVLVLVRGPLVMCVPVFGSAGVRMIVAVIRLSVVVVPVAVNGMSGIVNGGVDGRVLFPKGAGGGGGGPSPRRDGVGAG